MRGDAALLELEAVDWAFRLSTRRDLTHDLHPWPAKFIPDIPATAIRTLCRPGDLVLDPFCGCGTTAVEALRAGCDMIAIDVNPLAALIAEAKTTIIDAPTRQAVRDWASALRPIQAGASPAWRPPIPNIDYWFDEPIQAQLSALLAGIEAFEAAQAFLKVAFASIIVGASRQESETRYRRIERKSTPAEIVTRFQKRVDVGLRMLADFEVAAKGCGATIVVADARSFTEATGTLQADLAVFSPPYPNAFDYHLYHRFRMFWLSMDPRPIKHQEIGAHLKYEPSSVWEADMKAAFDQVSISLRRGGHALCVVGDGLIKGEIFRSADALWALAPSVGLEPVWRTERTVSRSRRSFNLSDSRLREEHVLVFRR